MNPRHEPVILLRIVMLAHLHRRMATVASLSKVIVTSTAALQCTASTTHVNTRSVPSVRRFSSASLSSTTSLLRSFGAQPLYESKRSRSKRMTTTSASSESQADSRQYFALTYDYVADILEKRGPHRPGHIDLAKAEEAQGKMLLGGAWGAPVDGALFIWLVNSADEVQQFVDKDPYVTAGLVTKYDIRPVAAAVGTWVTAAKK